MLRSPCGRLLERAAGLKGASIFEDGHRGIRYGKRPLLIVAAVGAAAALAVAGAGAPPATVGQAAADQQPPNVVVITTDDQTLESMRVMDNVNSLIGGNRGTTFQNSFVNFSLCCPSRATFLTGQYMHNHGVRTNKPPDGGFERFLELHQDNNLAVWLQDSGYHTAMIGKTLNGYAGDLVPDGWSEWYASTPNDQEVYDYTLNENGTPVHYGTDRADFKQDVLTARRSTSSTAGRRAGTPSSSGSPTRRRTRAHRSRARIRSRPSTAMARRGRRRATPTRSTPSRCRGPRTSTRPTSPTSPSGSATCRF